MKLRQPRDACGDLIIWLCESLAGIASDPARPGFKHIVMRPQPVGDLSFVSASHRSPYGLIRSAWTRQTGAFEWEVEIPPTTTATLHVPARSGEAVTEDGKPLARGRRRRLLHAEAGRVVLDVGSGEYRFTVR
jgi:alpha-L-rhamnosidase